ncbi:MAG: alpha-amylase family glycosyl hydrolase [Candidatus Woesearchaeota archaeon]
MIENIPLRAINYQWETVLYSPKIEPKKEYKNKFGYKVLERKEGKAKKVEFKVYSKNIEEDIYLIGEFNNWGKKNLENFKLKKQEDFSSIIIDCIKHNEPYLYLIDEKYLRDPATILFDDTGNSIFWDFDDETSYKLKFNKPERIHTSIKILQTDIIGLVAKWFEFDKNSKTLAESKKDLFTYISECGVLEKINELGFNAIQFLPIAQSIDGDNWKYRYLVTYPFAIHKNFGNPNSFLKMIDKCHELGIIVILDAVLSHCPYKDYKMCNIEGKDIGLHNWKTKNNNEIYLDETTTWGTKRYKYDDENVRNYLIESVINFLTNYFVDGFRIDNVDGILRFNESGDGKERPGGLEFLQKLNKEIYYYDSSAIIDLEAHYFYGDNAKNLVAPFSFSKKSLGATAYNSSRITYYLHSEYMPKSADKISIWKLEHIREEKEWGKSNSTVGDFHNHDAAAGLMYGRATGSYAYDALTLNKPELHNHAIGKIKVMESFIAFGLEGRILDILQTFLLQKGTFEHDSSIDWKKLNQHEIEEVVELKKQINIILDKPAFWIENAINRKYINVDDNYKILVIERKDSTQKTNETYYILINFSGSEIQNYSFGVEEENKLILVLDSENLKEKYEESILPKKSNKFEFFSREVNLKQIKPYQIYVFKKIN